MNVHYKTGYYDRESDLGYWSGQPDYWGYRYSGDHDLRSPRTPPVGSSRESGVRYIDIQPRGSDSRDQRMLLPITKKRKGNNKYGQSGSHRCLRCQRGKRKCVYNSKHEECQRCVERGFDDCGEKLPTPRKQAAQRKLDARAAAYNKDSDESSSASVFSPRAWLDRQVEDPLLPIPNTGKLRPLVAYGPKPEDEALYKLWNNLSI